MAEAHGMDVESSRSLSLLGDVITNCKKALKTSLTSCIGSPIVSV